VRCLQVASGETVNCRVIGVAVTTHPCGPPVVVPVPPTSRHPPPAPPRPRPRPRLPLQRPPLRQQPQQRRPARPQRPLLQLPVLLLVVVLLLARRLVPVLLRAVNRVRQPKLQRRQQQQRRGDQQHQLQQKLRLLDLAHLQQQLLLLLLLQYLDKVLSVASAILMQQRGTRRYETMRNFVRNCCWSRNGSSESTQWRKFFHGGQHVQ